MPAMTDITIDPFHRDDDAELSKPSDNPWMVDSSTQDLVSDMNSQGFTLPDFSTGQIASFPSPVHGAIGPELPPMDFCDTKDDKAVAGVCGLYNLGNTCFMSAGLHCLISNPRLVQYFLEDFEVNDTVKETLAGKFAAVLEKVWSGQFSVLHPREFKEALSIYHPQFKDYRQHDCQEFLALLLDTLHEQLNKCVTSAGHSDLITSPHDEHFLSQAPLCSPPSSPSITSPATSISPAAGPTAAADPSRQDLHLMTSSGFVLQPSTEQLKFSSSASMSPPLASSSTSKYAVLASTAGGDQAPNVSPSLSHHSDSESNQSVPSDCSSVDSQKGDGLGSHRMQPIPEEMKRAAQAGVTSTSQCYAASSSSPVATSMSNQEGATRSSVAAASSSGLNFVSASSSAVASSGNDFDMVNDGPADLSGNSDDVMDGIEEEDETGRGGGNKQLLNNVGASRKVVNEAKGGGGGGDVRTLPTIEDLYMKDTKVLNTNVLADADEDEVTMDSEKYHKVDNHVRVSAAGEEELAAGQLEEAAHAQDTAGLAQLMLEAAAKQIKPLKETNLLANQKDKFADDSLYNKTMLFSEISGNDDYNINNIKRVKIDEEEKNLRMQQRLKENKLENTSAVCGGPSGGAALVVGAGSGEAGGSGDRSGGGSGGTKDQAVPGSGGGGGCSSNNEEAALTRYGREADRAWQGYLEANSSIVVDTFQGQFKSTVVCQECHHMSVTFEPFMYLSVPLPHAMERQICVLFVPCDSRTPIRYLLTLHKTDRVHHLKASLLTCIGEESADIIAAEVLDNHISRILEDNMMLQFINDSSREIYAFEMLPPPELDDPKPASQAPSPAPMATALTVATPNNLVTSSTDAPPPADADSVSSSSTAADSRGLLSPNNEAATVSSSSATVATAAAGQTAADALSDSFIDNSNVWNSSSQCNSQKCDNNLPWQLREADSSSSSSVVAMDNAGTADPGARRKVSCQTDSAVVESSTGGGGNGESVADTQQDCTSSVADDSGAPAADQWKSCAICLEEMVDSDLMVHVSCGGTLCPACLEMSVKHFGATAFQCPVCSTFVNPTEEFIMMDGMADYKPKTRLLCVAVVQRYDEALSGGEVRRQLFGHPNILYLPSNISGEALYENVDRVVPVLANYSIVLTDGQGYHCSRCLFPSHCAGCEVPRDGAVSLQPNDHLTVTYTSAALTPHQLAEAVAGAVDEHHSMAARRPQDEPLTLYDCFAAFTQSEVLDEHNPWYCPMCRKNQCANKTMTVWRYPNTLVVYLKRFVFHELASTKIDSKVAFPVTRLDVSDYISGPTNDNLMYDLVACVNHFGGVSAGHYTAYSKHAVTGEWFYYNDETSCRQQPRDDDFANAYILFYQRHGTKVDLSIPATLRFSDPVVTTAHSSMEVTGGVVAEETTTNISHLLSDLDTETPVVTDGDEDDSRCHAGVRELGQGENKDIALGEFVDDGGFEFYS